MKIIYSNKLSDFVNDDLKIDLCIATKNSINDLPYLIESIKNQTLLDNTRLLVADSKSVDGTLEILKKIPFTKIISFSDNSPEEGFNKLLIKDQTNLKIIISSDDYLSNNYLDEYNKAARNLINKGIKKFILLPKFYKNFGNKSFNFDLPLPIFFLNFIGICRGIGFGIYNNYGALPSFNENIKYASDFELLIRCLKNGYYFKYVECKYYHSKRGRSAINWFIALKEEKAISLKYNKNPLIKIFIKILFDIKYIYKLIRT